MNTAEGELLKKDFMLKRSQLKGRFKKLNYRSRWFILTERVLRYHDGTLQTGERGEKGRIYLQSVRAVELADEQALDNKPNAFQIVYRDSAADELVVLYIFALHKDQRDSWIDAIRTACDKNGTEFGDKYHPGVWDLRNQRYSCCDSIRKDMEGCQLLNFKAGPQGNNVNGDDRVNMGTPGGAGMGNRMLPLTPNNHTKDTPAPPPRPEVIKKVIALYDYDKAEDTDLSLIKGDLYEILDDTRQFWWLAINKQKEEGYIPANYVEETTDQGLEEFDWFYPSTSRTQSEEILKKEEREGCFLVRNASNPGMYTLSIYTREVPEGVVRHYHIKLNDDRLYYLSDKHPFKAIPELIHYHKHNSAGLIVRLRFPPPERGSHQPATAGLGHDLFEIDPKLLDFGDVLGKGQFGMVRLATFNKKQGKSQEVAVKEMKEGTMSEDDFIEEARTMMQLTHPNLVQLFGVCTKSRPIYIICEYMKNGALLQYLRRRKNSLFRNPPRLTAMCTQICSAMQYLESKNFIHRDLAARNCLVNEKVDIKVGDFGLARFVIDDEYTCSTGTKFPIKWAPPEVLQYTKFSSKSDVWAFGVLMWEIWTGGEMPYGKMRNTDVIEKVVHQQYRLEKPANCPDNMYNIMTDTWQKTPEARPSFADLLEIFQDLQRNDETAGYLS